MTAGHHLLHTPISLGNAAAALSFDLASHLQPFGTACPSYPYSLSLDHTHITSCQCHPIVMIPEETRLLRWGLARYYNLEIDPGGKPYSSVCQLSLDKPCAQIIKPISWIH